MKKILVVDDEIEICNMLKDYFQMEGYLVYTAFDGLEALRQIACRPDIILLDINMPKMDGYKLCERIRKKLHVQFSFYQQERKRRTALMDLK